MTVPALDRDRDVRPSDETNDRAGDARRLFAELANRGERDLFEALRKDDFAGPKWDAVADQLAHYGLAVLSSWMRTEDGLFRLRDFGVFVTEELRSDLRADPALREGVVNSAIVDGLVKFRQSARERTGWDPDGGARLRTYFIRGCLYALSDGLRKLDRERFRRSRTETSFGNELEAVADATQAGRLHGGDPAEFVADQDLVHRWLATLPEQDRAVVQAKAEGYSHTETAEILGLTPKAVERRWARLIQRHEGLRNL
ncbi:sigma-70 family RNA polymerase sigma factor [Nocardia sp. alder85J]|uniref:sigma-70 family RNA polymerase sigma factor n=1 Tax=Nocardia sp. alder85J TaxID=2862949 RepID=UPI001CD2D807|nr:sigma-70 family RNA polymerase sigma factor [Nocardia sp. alder85J]MCX4099231.1 sigma-70 family RNA polymerase sigma factor [Nocardia sp. alder85J]